MSYFHVIKEVLDELFQDIPGNTDVEKYAAINLRIPALSSSYYQLTESDRTPIDYSDPVSKFAYVYMYTACHAELIAQVVRGSELLPMAASDPGHFRATCIGGGPGSDVVGLLDTYGEFGGAKNFHAWLIDKEASWGDCWGEISRFIDQRLNVTTQVEPLNLTELQSIEKAIRNSRHFLRADLVTMSFFISEMYSFRHQAHDALIAFLASMRSGAHLLFIDNCDEDRLFVRWFDRLAQAAGLETLVAEERRMSIEEKSQKVALGGYLQHLNRQPKQNANAVYRICRKQ